MIHKYAVISISRLKLLLIYRLFILRTQYSCLFFFFFFQAEDGIRDYKVTGVQTCALPISSGAPIEEMNCVRAHLSRLKGGGLARALHAAGVTRARAFVAVDVPIGGVRAVSSGPAIADETTCADALALARKYGLPPAATRVRETLKARDPAQFLQA